MVPCYGDIPQEIHLLCVAPGQCRHGLLERKEILMLTRRSALLSASATALFAHSAHAQAQKAKIVMEEMRGSGVEMLYLTPPLIAAKARGRPAWW